MITVERNLSTEQTTPIAWSWIDKFRNLSMSIGLGLNLPGEHQTEPPVLNATEIYSKIPAVQVFRTAKQKLLDQVQTYSQLLIDRSDANVEVTAADITNLTAAQTALTKSKDQLAALLKEINDFLAANYVWNNGDTFGRNRTFVPKVSAAVADTAAAKVTATEPTIATAPETSSDLAIIKSNLWDNVKKSPLTVIVIGVVLLKIGTSIFAKNRS